MSDYQINIIYAGKDDGASDLADKLADSLKQVQDQGEKTKEKGESIFSKFTITAGDAVHAVQSVVGAVEGLAGSLIGGNAEFEQYNVRFTTLLHSASAAKDRMAELADFGQRTPFELPEVVKADTILQGFGLHSEEAAKKFGFAGTEIRTIAGDVASGTGASFEEMSLLIGKFSSGATGEAISRMQELGITSRDEMRKLGLTFSKAGELTSPLPEAMNTVLTLMKQKYGGLMDAQSQTFDGMLSNLSDWKGSTLRELGAPIFDAVKPQLAGLLAFLGSSETRQIIHDFAHGLGAAIQAVPPTVQAVGSAIHDYGIPAVEGLSAALLIYASQSIPAAVAAIPGLIAEATAATAAFTAQAVAVAAALGPFAILGGAVMLLAHQYAELQNRADEIAAKLGENRQEYQYSTDVLQRYSETQGYAKQATQQQADALQSLRDEQQKHIRTLAELQAKEEQFGNDARNSTALRQQHAQAVQAEKAEIERLGGAIGRQSEVLDESLKTYDEAHLHSTDAIEDMRAMRSAHGDLDQAVQLSEQELKAYDKTMKEVYEKGPQALGQAVQTENQFLAKSAEQQQQHEQKLSELQAQYADAKTAKAKAAVQEKIDAENAGYAQQQTDAAVAYAQQEAAQRAHLGQELIDYVNAQAIKDTKFREAADKLTGAIAQQYGVTGSMTTNYFGQMLNDIDAWAASGGQDADALAKHLGTTTDTAAATQRQMDELARKYTIELEEDLAAHKITAEEYARALRDIPSKVYTEIVTKHTEKYESSSQDTSTGGKRAGGGPVSASAPYLVGEDGPELFVPNVSGTIVSADVLTAALRANAPRPTSFTPTSPFAPVGGGAASTVIFQPGSIIVQGAAGQNVDALAEKVLDRIQSRINLRRT